MLPIVLVTGFLGAGKTTLMRRLVLDAQARGMRAAVIVNEFGDADIDSHILREADPALLEAMAGGCACCSGQDDLHEILLEWATRPATERPDVVLVEASGLADAVLLLEVVTAAPLLPLLRVGALVAVVDAVTWQQHASQLAGLLRRQVQLADLLIVNKVDALPPDALPPLREHLARVAPGAKQLPTVHCQFDLDEVWALAAGGPKVAGAHAIAPETGAQAHQGAGAHAAAHSVVCPVPHPVGRAQLENALSELPPGVWRAKGFVRLRGESGWFLVQFSGGDGSGRQQIAPFHLPFGAPEPVPALVFVGAHLHPAELGRAFDCTRLGAVL